MTWGSTPEEATASNRLIGGRYELYEQLGAGGMGAVWAGRDVLYGRSVAVKEALTAHRGQGQRVRREATAAMRINHPSVVTVYDVVEQDGQLWIVMERVHGESLASRLRRERFLPEPEAARIAIRVAEALAAAHAQHVLHRDVKPDNILLDPGGRVVLTDFGIAYIVGEESLTRSGGFIGSAPYTAPERMAGRKGEGSSDLWSLGVVLFEMVEGWSPFARDSVMATVGAVVEGMPPLEHAVGLRGLITCLLAELPEERPGLQQAIAELRAAVTAAEAHPDPATDRAAGGPPGAREEAFPSTMAKKGHTGHAVEGFASRAQRPAGLRNWRGALVAGSVIVVAAVAVPFGFHALRESASDDSPPPNQTQSSKSSSGPSATTSTGFVSVRQADFELKVPAGYEQRPKNSHAQYVYTNGEFKIIVTGGRDRVAEGGEDPLAYQRDKEYELEPFRNSKWASASGLRTIRSAGYSAAEGVFTWTTVDGEDVYVHNTVMLVEGYFHVVVVMGPESRREAVQELQAQVIGTYVVK
ncbi:serine/threonine-protein kinase [Streptomyces sp. NPDC058439]|uniref:serine/threonine-protein kinase n=1 Tax=Streptomyces sp. NPDC058439 TaxID=3346500 RepID=UPI00366A5007